MELVVGFSIPVETFNLSSIIEPSVHQADTLLSILLLLELHLDYSFRMRIIELDSDQITYFL